MKESTVKTYYSAAKINLYLRVEDQQSDGYHDLVSVMQSISLYDRLDFDFSAEKFSLKTGKQDLGTVENNTIYRAWHWMKERFSLPSEVEILLSKNIPVAAGLGGGSSNAAAVLHAVNDYFQLGLSLWELAEIGGEIGADVPFCVIGGTMLAKGKGERLTPVDPLPPCNILLTNNGAAVSTKEVFQAFDALPQREAPSERPLLNALAQGELTAIGKALYNDLASVTLKAQPALDALIEDWRNEGLYPLMSGSGPSIFALSPHEEWKTPFVNWERNKGKLFHVTPVSFGVSKENQ